MKRALIIVAMGAGALAMAAPAVGQPKVRDHRKGKKVRDHRDGKVRMGRRPGPGGAKAPHARGLSPISGAPGTTVRIRSRSLDAGTVRIGRRKVPAKFNKRHITFTIPTMRAGKHPVIVKADGMSYAVGMFEVTGAAGAATPTGPPPGPPPGVRPSPHGKKPGHVGNRRNRWKRYRNQMMVTSYYPKGGPAGTKVSIRGRGFTDGTKVKVGRMDVASMDVKPHRITFAVPKGAKDGMIRVMQGSTRMVVGPFDYKRKRRDKAQWKKLRAERRTRATKRWQEHQKTLPPKAEARRAWLAKRDAELKRTRAERRRARVARIRAKWEAKFLNHPQVRAEMTLHANRLARLQRMRNLAAVDNRGKLVVRIEVLVERENNRHSRRLGVLKASLAAN